MLQSAPLPNAARPAFAGLQFQAFPAASQLVGNALPARKAVEAVFDDEEAVVEWSEDDIVFLHWRLLQEVRHLADPAWTLTEAARIGCKAVAWPKQYASGKPQMEAIFAREKALAGSGA